MQDAKLVGRSDATIRLRQLLEGPQQSKLAIQSIEGPGGIGKTFLFEHVLGNTNLSQRNFLHLRIDGNGLGGGSLPTAVAGMVDGAKAVAIQHRAPRYYFPAVDKVIKAVDTIRAQYAAEIRKKYRDKATESELLKYFDIAVSIGKLVNGFPKTKKWVDFQAIEKLRPDIEEILTGLESLNEESPRFFERVGFISESRILRNSIKEKACQALSNALLSDLSAMLAGYRSKDWMKATHGQVKGVDRLLVVIDDYENLQDLLGPFLVENFLPELSNASFESLVVILGRDQLEATHPGWDQHLRANLLPRINLTPLARTDMNALVEMHGVKGLEEQDRAWADTQGYPFYIQLWIEEMASGGRTALMLQRFYDRTTRWMSATQKKWLHYALFLEEVNTRTLDQMVGGEADASEIFRWFEREGSVRDTTAAVFRVREYLRSRLIDYLSVSDPDYARAMRLRGDAAMQAWRDSTVSEGEVG